MVTSALEQSQAAVALGHSPIPVLRRLTIEETGEAIIIRGRVPSYYDKQLAQETLMPYLQGRSLQNQIIVVRP
jgi:hypothetical protein